MTSLEQFFYMGGYALYVWGAYSMVGLFLITQWFFPWKRWKQFLKTIHHEQNP